METFRSPFSFVLFLLLASVASSQNFLQILPKIHGAGSISDDGDSLYCRSWRFSVETNDAGPWQRIPSRCVGFVKEYMTGPLYASDCDLVAEDSIAFAEGVMISAGAGDGKAAWIFDVDETLLSNLPYYDANGYGSEAFNETAFDEWVDLATAPAIPASLRLYNELQLLGFRLILLTGRSEAQRIATEKNLLYSGYHSWESLILRGPSDVGKSAVVFKSEKRAWLESEGYNIHGSSGDQWSDLLGSHVAKRSFKLPNVMYYIL